MDASAICGLQYTDLEQTATRLLQCRFVSGVDDLVWASGIAGDFGGGFAVEASALAFVTVHTGPRVLVERANVYSNGFCDARTLCCERYALTPTH